ncbi:hypothetical protein TWF569_008488 [Orbilia oligospora]|uniref:Uncharacterized protein n=1 Tax=Orbilia oligospora TaxID=2813651 RepID=A0A7C8P9M2_ORBOL|nr:hypothetical protein TWF569_008488 [Orbilia oligospora]KAF3141684.1 hypothetical protein TWF703_001705 [Orbilia oligospora]
MLLLTSTEKLSSNLFPLRLRHLTFLQRTQEDCNKYAERFRTYCNHTQRICRELMKLSSWNIYQGEKLLIARETELMHMYCQLSDEVVRIRKHIDEITTDGFEGCAGDVNPTCRCWMGILGRDGFLSDKKGRERKEGEEEKEGKQKFTVLEFKVPDGKVSFLDNMDGILDVGRRAESAVYSVLRETEGYSSPGSAGFHGSLGLTEEGSVRFYDGEGGKSRPIYTSYFASDSD